MREMEKCANPSCKRMIEVITRSGNRKGRNEYCSSECWSTFSPAMRRVCEENKVTETKRGLRNLIMELRDEKKTRLEIASIFGITSKTLRVWSQKVGLRKF